ncbi:sugar transferase [Klenkia brasiliensis]|uniref:sugar transferase n=1 Tax=Klenkia brasiliensis TaxID=333142 RepID=UPI001F626181|nr:sugar transferase [Klenkia brasiliensis]
MTTTQPRASDVRRSLFAPSRLRGAGTEARRSWQSGYVRSVVLADLLCAVVAAVAGYAARFGTGSLGHLPVWVLPALPLAWVGAMLVARAYEQRFLWIGAEEFRRVFFAAMLMLATVGTVSWALKLDLARGFVVVTLPLATVLTLAVRWLLRDRLHRARSRGRYLQTAVLVGHRSGVAALKEQVERERHHGYTVVGCLLPGGEGLPEQSVFAGVPVLGGLDDVAGVVARFEVDTVAVLPCPELDGPRLRRLGWELEKTRAELLLAPAVTEIVGPRVRIRPVCGLPLLHMEKPELRGVRRLAKETVDRSASALALLLMLPVLVGIAAAVGLTSRGGVFFRQQRVGRDGQVFSMLKFRSMVAGAEGIAAPDDGNGVLFKSRTDPRVTRVGRVLRRCSLDELPQLLNVVRGDMSLVGPRPPLPSEVERYGFDMHRRFLVKPGITGLWQISGRSDLSWDDSVRIDVRYVENWSLTFDFMILCKTIRAVVSGSGAY